MLKITDEQFIECWQRHQGASAVAKELGLQVRNVYSRRRALEKKYGSLLTARHECSPTRTGSIDVSRGVAKWEVSDGMVFVFSDAHYWPG